MQTFQPGDHVSFIYYGARGTTLARAVVETVADGGYGRPQNITVKAPEDAAHADNGMLSVSGHPDFVSKYDPAEARLEDAREAGYSAGLGDLRAMQGFPAASANADAARLRMARVLAETPDSERDAVQAAFDTEYARIFSPPCQEVSMAGRRRSVTA